MCAFVEIAEIEEKNGLPIEHNNVAATCLLEILPCLLRYETRILAQPGIF